MLNELKMLSDSIHAAGFSEEEWDDKFKEIKVKGAPCFIVSLQDDGEIADIRFLEPNKAKVLRTWQGGSNGECFPCFNFMPFYEMQDEKQSPLSAQQKNAYLKEFISVFRSAEESPVNVGPVIFSNRNKADKKTSKCLGSIAKSFFSIMIDNENSNNHFIQFREAISKLITSSGCESFNRKMLSFLRKNITEELMLQKSTPTIWSILFKKAQNDDVVLFFDLQDSQDNPLASEKGMRLINANLLSKKSTVESSNQDRQLDAFGVPVSITELSEKLPEVKLPGTIANTKLRSMSSESKCQMRYGKIDAESFPIGSVNRKSAKIALSWISSPDREGKTWAIAGANELVFAYPKSIPQTPPLLARLLGNGRSASTEMIPVERRFEQYAQDALNGLKTLSEKPSPNTEIEVFAIKKADTARRKIVFYRNYSLANLEAAVDTWLKGSRNIPEIHLRKWPPVLKGEKTQKENKPVSINFQAPLPLKTIELAYTMWSKDGNEKSDPKYRSALLYEGIPVFDGLELFLGNNATTGLAERMLSFLLQGSLSLCVESGNIAHKPQINLIGNNRVAAYLETTLPLFGILLHKLNKKKEIYMTNAPFLIGKFLNLADGLHAVWCRNVKEKDPLPPQLLGSSLFNSFQVNPVQAFANAALRLKPYLDWAKTNQTKDVALARWYVGEFRRVSAGIEEAGIPVRRSDTDKAEMLLGYLASSGKADNSESTES